MITFTRGTDTINIRNPELGDAMQTNFMRIYRESRGTDLLVGRQVYWPKNKTFSLSFNFASYAEAKALREYYLKHRGYILTYVDYNSKSYSVRITSPDFIITQTGAASYTATLSLEKETY